MRFPLVTLLLCLLLPAPAFGWNKPGHMVTGAIAYDLLKQEHPQTLARVLELLRQHPQYDEIIAKRLEAVPLVNRDRYLFMIAARWADDVRNNRECVSASISHRHCQSACLSTFTVGRVRL